MKKLALAFIACAVLTTIACILSVLAKYYFPSSINSPFFFAGMIYEWYLIKKLEL